MKLENAYIENFGKLSQCPFDFSDGIYQICEPNGYGKSTLAAFLRAMFYGLPAARKNTRFNDRDHFYPFSGGRCGGNLTFSFAGNTYRVERFFDKKSAKDDTRVIYRGNTPTEEFDHSDKELGHFVFGIDAETFDRILLISSGDIDMEATAGISAKLSHLVNATDEASTYQSAVKQLDDARKLLRADRKNNANPDAYTRNKAEIERLTNEICNLEAISNALGEQYTRLNELQARLHAAEKAREATLSAAALTAKWETYDSFVAQASERTHALEALRETYPAGLPTAEELPVLKAASDTITDATQQLSFAHLAKQDENRLAALRTHFAVEAPTEETLASLDRLCEELTRVSADAERYATHEESERYRHLARTFSEGYPDEETLQEQDTRIRRIHEIHLLLEAETVTASPAPTPHRKKLPYLLAAVVSLLLAVGGGVTLLSSVAVGVALLVVGLAGLFLTAFFYLLKNQAPPPVTVPDTRRTDLVAEQNQLRDALRSFLAGYRYQAAQGVEADYATLKHDLAEYRALLAQRKAHSEKHAVACARMQEISAALTEALAAYGIAADPRVGIHALRREVNDYHRLMDEQARIEETRASLTATIREAREDYATRLAPYGILPQEDIPTQLATLVTARETTDRLTAEREELARRADAYRAAQGLTERPAETPTMSPEEDLTALISALAGERAKLLNRIDADEHAIEPLEPYRAQLEEAREKQKAIQARARLLGAAKTSLEQAETTLKERYVAPVKDVFLRYVAPLEAILGERIRIGENFTLSFEENGEYHSDRHLSAGQRAICALCYRMALIDNMYGEESPFLILDDPFVHLDPAHLDATLALLQRLSVNRQLLYFTCHDSRCVAKEGRSSVIPS